MEQLFAAWLNDPKVQALFWILLGIFIVTLVVRVLQRSLVRYIKDSDTRYRMRKFLTFVGYLLVIIVIVTVYSERLKGFAVALGVAGAGIAFALQEVIASVAGWVAISFGRFYRIGDRVMLGGIKGDVIDIGVFRTTVMEIGEWIAADQYTGRIVRVVNSVVFKEPIFNYSTDFPFLWDEITIPVKYGSDHRLAREILQEVAHEVVGDYVEYAKKHWKHMLDVYFIEEAGLQPTIALTANDNWIEFALRYEPVPQSEIPSPRYF